MKKGLILFSLTFILSINIKAQKIIVNGQESDGKLSWNDFTGKIDNQSSFAAYTAYKFKTKISSIEFVGDSAIVKGFEISIELDSQKSWAKPDEIYDELLIHEQGHFDIGILTMNEIIEKVEKASFTKRNIKKLLQSIVDEASKKYSEMDTRYDEETNHANNREVQNKWNIFFSEQLAIK